MIDWKGIYVKEGGGDPLRETFAKTLKDLRSEKGLSQQQLSEQLHVSRSTVASWETGLRLPSAVMILRIASCLAADPTSLIGAAEDLTEKPNVIIVDGARSARTVTLPAVAELFPNAAVACFTKPAEALAFARSKPVALALLETMVGTDSGLELCRELMKINPRTNVIFVTAFPEHALEAWSTGACGFLLKPLTPEALSQQLPWLRYPVRGLV